MSNGIYEKYNIDKNKLKRDYLKNPLIRSRSKYKNESIHQDDFQYLFIELNLSANDLHNIFGWSKDTIYDWSYKFNIKKSKENIIKHTKQTNLEKYGVEYVSQLNMVKNKSKQTKIKKYGNENYINIDKIKQTNLEKYGVEYYTQSNEYKEKEKERKTNLSVEELQQQKLKFRLLSMENKDNAYILSNKDLFIKTLKDNKLFNTSLLCSYFGINQSNMNKLIREYDIRYLLNNSFTSQENELIKYLEQHFTLSVNNRNVLDGKEIDIFIPDLNIGIEFNGNWWHNEKVCTNKLYHQEKSKLAEEKGIFLYHIFEYEWNTKKEQILNQLNNLLGINNEKIYARNCIIKNVSNKDKKQFLENNHLQDNDSSSIKLGLYYNNHLVSLMTFCKPRFNKKYEWELSRFCSKAGCNVIGGASKLFKYFINEYSPKSIISYSNIAHTKGNLYKMLGFNLESISEPNYVWYRSNKFYSRYQCQKHKLLEQGFDGKSETEIMHNRGYYRIYDCGNKIWSWFNK